MCILYLKLSLKWMTLFLFCYEAFYERSGTVTIMKGQERMVKNGHGNVHKTKDQLQNITNLFHQSFKSVRFFFKIDSAFECFKIRFLILDNLLLLLLRCFRYSLNSWKQYNRPIIKDRSDLDRFLFKTFCEIV